MDLKSRLTKIIEAGGVPFRQTSISWIFTCPRCDKAGKLYLRKSDGRFICFYCSTINNFKGKPEWALAALYHESVQKLQEVLYGVPPPENLGKLVVEWVDHWGEFGEEELFDIPTEVPGIEWPIDFCRLGDDAFGPGYRYLRGRGITVDHMRTYGIAYQPPEQRVIFPVYVGEKLLGWQGRIIHDTSHYNEVTGKEYKAPKAMTHFVEGLESKPVMFQNRLASVNHCVLTEGPVDAIKADLCGGNVAALGKGVTDAQIKTIGTYVRRLYIALDTNAADDIARIFNTHFEDFEMFVMEPPRGRKDLGVADPEEVLESFHHAKPLFRGQIIVSMGDKLIY